MLMPVEARAKLLVDLNKRVDLPYRFVVEGDLVTVQAIGTGYRKRVLADPAAEPRADTPLSVHRAFVERFASR